MNPKIILASQSPRRVSLLHQMGLEFQQIPSNFDEYLDDDRSVYDIAQELATGKAQTVADQHPDAVVVGSDLIVVVDGRQLGKPADADDAEALLRLLSGRPHELVCAVAVICKTENYHRVQSETATVHFREFTDEFIRDYVATGTTYDKAGGYAIQHPLVQPFVESIDGPLDVIIGLPTHSLSAMLADLGINASPIIFKTIVDLDERLAQ